MSNNDYIDIPAINNSKHHVRRNGDEFEVILFSNGDKIVKGTFENDFIALLAATILDMDLQTKDNSIFRFFNSFFVFNISESGIQYFGMYDSLNQAKEAILDNRDEISFELNQGETIANDGKFGVYNGSKFFGSFDSLNIADVVRHQLKLNKWDLGAFINCQVLESDDGYFALKTKGSLVEFVGYHSSTREVKENFHNPIISDFNDYGNNMYFFDSVTTLDELFLPKYNNKLYDVDLTVDDYQDVLKEILNDGKRNINFHDDDSIFDKIANVVSAYANWEYKFKGPTYGQYQANFISLDDRTSISQRISTLIHELSHHLLAEIFENLFCRWLSVKKTQIVEGFVESCLFLPEFKIINEYCAHTVQGRFIPIGYQSYSSFMKMWEEYEELPNKELLVVVGNTIASDIIDILENFIDSNMRDEIRLQFMEDSEEKSEDIMFELEYTCDSEEIVYLFQNAILVHYNNAKVDEEVRELIYTHYRLFDDSY